MNGGGGGDDEKQYLVVCVIKLLIIPSATLTDLGNVFWKDTEVSQQST